MSATQQDKRYRLLPPNSYAGHLIREVVREAARRVGVPVMNGSVAEYHARESEIQAKLTQLDALQNEYSALQQKFEALRIVEIQAFREREALYAELLALEPLRLKSARRSDDKAEWIGAVVALVAHELKLRNTEATDLPELNDGEIAHICARFDAAHVELQPFPYLVIDEVLPPNLFREIEASAPCASTWETAQRELGEPPSFPLDNAHCRSASLQPFAIAWRRKFAAALRVIGALTALKLRPQLDKYFSALFACGMTRAIQPPTLGIGPNLFCLRPEGWVIPPHVHQLRDVVQCMIYCPLPGSSEAQGTILHSIDPDAQITSEVALATALIKPEVLRSSSLIGYRENRLVAFLSAPISAHSTQQVPGGPARRYFFFALAAEAAAFHPVRTPVEAKWFSALSAA